MSIWSRKGKPCPHCSVPMKMETKVRGKLVSRGLKRAKKMGQHVGRPKSFDYYKALDLRKSGLSFRKIAAELGVSSASVCRAVNGFK